MKIPKIPTQKDWGDYKTDLEVKYAYKLYGGLSIQEASEHFIRSPIERASELRFAPFAVFRYYVFCFVNFLTATAAAGESDAASVFLGLVRDMSKKYPLEFARFYPTIEHAVKHVALHQNFYEADENIYGSFPTLLREIEKNVLSHRE